MKYRLLLSVMFILLNGCSSNNEVKLEQFENKQAKFIYNTGKTHLDNKEYKNAIKIFEELQRQYPYSKYIPLVQIHIADCYYSMKKYDEAMAGYEVFIKTHATHKLVPYALFTLGKLSYEQMPIIERDQEITIQAYGYFNALVNQYPDSQYVKEANDMIKIIRNHLAGRELYIARYYISKRNYAAAICRLNTIIDNYEDTNIMPEALHRLIECYLSMSLVDEAKKVFEVLKNNHKQTTWYQHSYKLMSEIKN